MYFAFGYGLYFYFTWLPTYLIKVLGFSLLGGGFFAVAAVPARRHRRRRRRLADRPSVRATHGLRVGRCHLGFAAFLTVRAAGVRVDAAVPPVAKALLLALALASADLALGACWARADRHRAAITPASSPAS